VLLETIQPICSRENRCNWTARTSAADNDWFGVTYGNGGFVSVASTGTGDQAMTMSWQSQ